jgi:hypothetical protein
LDVISEVRFCDAVYDERRESVFSNKRICFTYEKRDRCRGVSDQLQIRHAMLHVIVNKIFREQLTVLYCVILVAVDFQRLAFRIAKLLTKAAQ